MLSLILAERLLSEHPFKGSKLPILYTTGSSGQCIVKATLQRSIRVSNSPYQPETPQSSLPSWEGTSSHSSLTSLRKQLREARQYWISAQTLGYSLVSLAKRCELVAPSMPLSLSQKMRSTFNRI